MNTELIVLSHEGDTTITWDDADEKARLPPTRRSSRRRLLAHEKGEAFVEIGDRVRMVQTRSFGIIAGEVFKSDRDGSDRIPVKWENSGTTTNWQPEFLRPDDTNPEDDPEEVRCGQLGRRKGRMSFDDQGTLIIEPEGFFKVVLSSATR